MGSRLIRTFCIRSSHACSRPSLSHPVSLCRTLIFGAVRRRTGSCTVHPVDQRVRVLGASSGVVREVALQDLAVRNVLRTPL
jgi:hypothetical protein